MPIDSGEGGSPQAQALQRFNPLSTGHEQCQRPPPVANAHQIPFIVLQ